MSVASPSPIRHAPLAFWRVASAFLRTLHMLFGGPEQVAFLQTLSLKEHAQMSSWLRAGEAMMRRLLLIEASAFPKPNTRPLLHARRSRTLKPFIVEDDKPETWRVSFRAFAPGPRRARPKAPSTAVAARLRRLRQLGAQSGQPIRIFRDESDTARGPKNSAANFRRRRTKPSRPPCIRSQDRFWVHENDLKPQRFCSAWPVAQRYEALLRAFNDPAPYAQRLARRLHAAPHRLRDALSAPPEADRRIDAFEALGENARAVWRAHFSSA